MSRSVVCLAPHPDDESIGCGGTLAQHVSDGDAVRIVWLTSGEAAEDVDGLGGLAARREREAVAAAGVLGAVAGGFWRLPDGGLEDTLDQIPRLVQLLESADVLYAPHPADGHPDHRAAARMVQRALPSLPTLRGWGYEIWTPIAEPHWVNDISDHIDTKIRAIRAHRTQCAVVAFDDAAEGLARYRAGLHCWPGRTHAEAFVPLAASPT